ncbi:protein FAR1-RELATED SEQUENCE 5-like [Cornus florida]|uniref:protein FAR1-RELATED SEQUENCE 5-like n=1 Tax=Cornus florida TaxID=4283 RepID=UPI0028A22A70|nr:protein FAR1-RELATED SEQUENCE 5-like [Cornus florida]
MEEVLNNIEDTSYTENAPIARADVVEWKPGTGMKFETEEVAYDFYNLYAGRVDFSIHKEYFNKSKKIGKLSSRMLTCCKEGFRVDDICHNHPLMIDEGMHMLSSQRRITRVQANDLELASDSGITPRNSYELLGRQADSKMIVDYCNFGDVVSFDTTYKVIHGNHPFRSFLGLNYHWDIAVFGATFMYKETADSFLWLFQTFLKAMSDKASKTIFTDQDTAMGKVLTQAYLSRQLILPDFFTHFERLLSDKRYKEYVAEYGLLHNLP